MNHYEWIDSWVSNHFIFPGNAPRHHYYQHAQSVESLDQARDELMTFQSTMKWVWQRELKEVEARGPSAVKYEGDG